MLFIKKLAGIEQIQAQKAQMSNLQEKDVLKCFFEISHVKKNVK